MAPELSPGQRLLLQRKIHVAGGAYARSVPALRQRFPSGWSAAIGAVCLLGGLPETAIRWWAGQPNGHLLLTDGDASYATVSMLDGDPLTAVAGLPIGWLMEGKERALAAALRPLDHLLGCGGAADGRWLSDGGGITPHWQRIGALLARLFALGYGASEASRLDPHAYWAEGLALALTDRQALNMNDPKLERLLGSSLLSSFFWQRNCPK